MPGRSTPTRHSTAARYPSHPCASTVQIKRTGGVPRAREPCDAHMARFAVEVLGIELTEGQPSPGWNQQKRSTHMKKLLAAVDICQWTLETARGRTLVVPVGGR